MRNKGFTLIELVIVIVILGILAATAAPKFIDLSGDAREASMNGLLGSINSAVEITHAKALIEGQTTGTKEIQIGNTTATDNFYALVNGYPVVAATTADGTTGKGYGIDKLLEIDFTNTDYVYAAGVFTIKGATGTCSITYTNATAGNRPNIAATLTGC